MTMFPRTTVGGVSLSRMIVGTNWFLGWSHTTAAKDAYITTHIKDRKYISEILEVFVKAGVDTIMGNITCDPLHAAIQDAQQRTGKKIIMVSTPGFPVNPKMLTAGWDLDEVARILDKEVELGARFCLPHTSTTDCLIDKVTREIRGAKKLCEMIRQRGLIPGLSTHMPESIIFADESGLDVETYISIFNSMGFLMQVEVDWVANVIRNARKPVMTIKPMAAGQLRPFQAMIFAWNAIREQDMITVGTMSPREAHEIIEISLNILNKQAVAVKLQETRSKSTIKPKTPAIKV
ncbi:MAG: hypothetical protein HZA50_18535 [Planctomycetes bacterium]|nr:hypothetical protein [Planctomycetota bacterium]